MVRENNMFGRHNDDNKFERCCPRVVFAILPTGPTGGTGVGPTHPVKSVNW